MPKPPLVVIEIGGGNSDPTTYGKVNYITFDWDNLKMAETRKELEIALDDAMEIPKGAQRKRIINDIWKLLVKFDAMERES